MKRNEPENKIELTNEELINDFIERMANILVAQVLSEEEKLNINGKVYDNK